MKLSKKSIQYCIDTVTARVAQKYAQKKHIPFTDALRFFMSTETFSLLIEPQSYLFLESAEYTLDMLDAELNGDWDRWFEV